MNLFVSKPPPRRQQACDTNFSVSGAAFPFDTEHGTGTRLVKESNRLIGQRLSALCSASCQHLATVAGRHSLAETVLNLSLTLFRLVCPYHCVTPLSGFQTKSILMYYSAFYPKMSIQNFIFNAFF